MQKIKKQRSADCVVGGFRYASNSKVIGSLLLGLYNEQDLLDHVGFCSGLKANARKELKKTVEPLIEPPGFTGHARRVEPLEHQTLNGMEAPQAQTGRGGQL